MQKINWSVIPSRVFAYGGGGFIVSLKSLSKRGFNRLLLIKLGENRRVQIWCGKQTEMIPSKLNPSEIIGGRTL